MKNKILCCCLLILLLSSCNNSVEKSVSTTDTESSLINFSNVSVHDPSIINDNGTYYIIGSHLAFAKSNDLKDWTQLESQVQNGNRLFPTPYTTLSEIFNYTSDSDTTNRTLWAGDIIKLNGIYYYYLSACEGSQPLSELAVSTSSSIEGPYSTPTKIFRSGGASGTDGYYAPNGTTKYNSSTMPNVVDPAVFYNASKSNLYMVYGSYSGGIFITELDTSTGMPKNTSGTSMSDNGYGFGTKLLGQLHARIEAPYIIYNSSTGYYYLFLSFGGLSYDGNYNVRVARATNPAGPYYDAEGNNMINCKATSVFNDYSVSDYGVKILGNYTWSSSTTTNEGYVSPGHNSAYYDSNTGKYFIIFHTRFPNASSNESHQVRVHEMKFNEEGWPVVLPFRYSELDETKVISSMSGTYKVIVDKDEFSGTTFKPTVKTPVNYVFNSDGTLTGEGITSGTWVIGSNNKLTLNLVKSGKTYTYYGFIQNQYNEYENKIVTSFSVMEEDGYGIIAYQ